jgi:hypothetical protein
MERTPFCSASGFMGKGLNAREADDAEIRRLIVEHAASDNAPSVEIPIPLAGNQHNLRFVGTHWFDLKTVLEN